MSRHRRASKGAAADDVGAPRRSPSKGDRHASTISKQIAADDNADVRRAAWLASRIIRRGALKLKHGQLALAIEKAAVVRVEPGSLAPHRSFRCARPPRQLLEPAADAIGRRDRPSGARTPASVCVPAAKSVAGKHVRPRRGDQMRDAERRTQHARALDHRRRHQVADLRGGSFCSLRPAIAIKYRPAPHTPCPDD